MSKWESVSEASRQAMKALGHFSPTVIAENMEVKGRMLDEDGESCKTYLSAADLRGLAAACIEVAEWLERRSAESGF